MKWKKNVVNETKCHLKKFVARVWQGEYASPTGGLERTRGPSGSGGINLEKLARDMQVPASMRLAL